MLFRGGVIYIVALATIALGFYSVYLVVRVRQILTIKKTFISKGYQEVVVVYDGDKVRGYMHPGLLRRYLSDRGLKVVTLYTYSRGKPRVLDTERLNSITPVVKV